MKKRRKIRWRRSSHAFFSVVIKEFVVLQ